MNLETISKDIVAECKKRLIASKSEILNRVRDVRQGIAVYEEKTGDEADQTVRAMAESETLSIHERLRSQLTEIELALSRIENGTFGVCEETEEAIEPERLLAIPWTRLSIEGAEIRESLKRRFAR